LQKPSATPSDAKPNSCAEVFLCVVRCSLMPTLTYAKRRRLYVSAITCEAWEALLRNSWESRRDRPQKVLVNGASGGIGTFAVQIAKSLGAEVTGVCSTSNVKMVRSIGADHVIDYTRDDFTQSGTRYDFILDNISNRSLSDLRRALTARGMLVPNGGQFQNRWFSSAGRLIKAMVSFRFVSQRLGRFVVAQKHDDLLALKELIEAGKVMPVIDRTYPLSETAAAMDYVGTGHARGKVVINV
jgi:NADPH:quinone reductase-like Zn-dependent oxidoreductase